MKIAVSSEQKRFFERHQIIELEGLLSPQAFANLKQAVFATLALRLNTEESKLNRNSAQQLFCAGRDIWRTHAEVRKIITSSSIGELLYDLMDSRPIRLAYDQVLPCQRIVQLDAAEPAHYAELTKYNTTMEEISSIQGVLGAIIFCIDGPYAAVDGWPSQPGNALVVTGKAILSLSSLQAVSGGIYYAVVYARDKALYIQSSSDPLTYSFKQVGYNPGDRLQDKYNPVTYR